VESRALWENYRGIYPRVWYGVGDESAKDSVSHTETIR